MPDGSDYKNYRPVSNLGFVSKFIERAIADQLKLYISTSNLDNELHSAYIDNHNTESAPLKVVSAIRLATDQNQGVILVLLSAAFDTVDDNILVGRLASVVKLLPS